VKVEFINPFISATIKTFQSMLGEKLTPGKAELKQSPFPVFDISGIIGLSGGLVGNVVLSFPKPTALRAASAFLDQKIKTIDNELYDSIQEITNIVAGSALPELSIPNVSFSLPNIVIGQNHEIRPAKGSVSIIVPFSSSFGPFSLEVNIKENH